MSKTPPDPDRESHGMRLRTALAGLATIALGMVLAILTLADQPGDGPLRSTAGLSTMAGVAAHDADRATNGIQLSPRMQRAPATSAALRGEPEAQVIFDPGSSTLPEGLEPLFTAIVTRLSAHPGAIAVISAADPGSRPADARYALPAESRLLVVRDALAAHGIPANRLMIDPKSSRSSRVDETGPARIEIHILRG